MWKLQMFMWAIAFGKYQQEGSAPRKTCGFLAHPLQMHRSEGPSGWQAVRRWWVVHGGCPDFTAVLWSVCGLCQYYMLERNRPLCVWWREGISHTRRREQLMWFNVHGVFVWALLLLFDLWQMISSIYFGIEATATRFYASRRKCEWW